MLNLPNSEMVSWTIAQTVDRASILVLKGGITTVPPTGLDEIDFFDSFRIDVDDEHSYILIFYTVKNSKSI